MENIIFWSGAGFISSHLLSNIFINNKNDLNHLRMLRPFTTICLLCGFIRGYTGKSICEAFCT